MKWRGALTKDVVVEGATGTVFHVFGNPDYHMGYEKHTLPPDEPQKRLVRGANLDSC